MKGFVWNAFLQSACVGLGWSLAWPAAPQELHTGSSVPLHQGHGRQLAFSCTGNNPAGLECMVACISWSGTIGPEAASWSQAMIAGRFLAGVGIGLSSALVPLYISEVHALPHQPIRDFHKSR